MTISSFNNLTLRNPQQPIFSKPNNYVPMLCNINSENSFESENPS